MAEKKTKTIKGQHKQKPDTDDPNKNPLLHIENKIDFSISTANLLETPNALIHAGFEGFDLSANECRFDTSKLDYDSEIIITLVYYEYVCAATFKFSYIIPLLESELDINAVFRMIKHSLKNKLLCNVPSFDNVIEPEIMYFGKIRY